MLKVRYEAYNFEIVGLVPNSAEGKTAYFAIRSPIGSVIIAARLAASLA